MRLVDEWRSWWRQSSSQLAVLSAVALALSWFADNYSELSQFVYPGVFQVISFAAAVLVPIARNIVQQSVTRAKADAQRSDDGG